MIEGRSLARVVLEDEDFGERFHELVKAYDADAVRGAISSLTTQMRPLLIADGESGSETAEAIISALSVIGAKVSPQISLSQGRAWRDAVLIALSDLPGSIALESIRAAIHTPFGALWEVEKKVREIADEKAQRQKLALHRLEQMLAAIQRAASQPPPMLEAPDADRPFTLDEIRAMTAPIRRMGLKAGWITRGQIDALEATDAAG